MYCTIKSTRLLVSHFSNVWYELSSLWIKLVNLSFEIINESGPVFKPAYKINLSSWATLKFENKHWIII